MLSPVVIHTCRFHCSSSPRHIVCSYRVRPRHGTYSPWSRSSVLVIHALVTESFVLVVHVLTTESFVLVLALFALSSDSHHPSSCRPSSHHHLRPRHVICTCRPARHDIRFRRSSPSSSSSPSCLRFRQFACVDGFSSSAPTDPTYDSSFASSLSFSPWIWFQIHRLSVAFAFLHASSHTHVYSFRAGQS